MTGSLNQGSNSATTALLQTGKVLIAGGDSQTPPSFATDRAELYDPVTGIWTPTASMNFPRVYHAGTLLKDGRFLVSGGENPTPIVSCEIYDPTSETWEETGDLLGPRQEHTAALLPSGDVVVAGGLPDTGPLRDIQTYDPSTQRWGHSGVLGLNVLLHAMVVLPSGEVLVIGGQTYKEFTGPITNRVEIGTPISAP